jgi:hypothetical protein
MLAMQLDEKKHWSVDMRSPSMGEQLSTTPGRNKSGGPTRKGRWHSREEIQLQELFPYWRGILCIR